MASILWVSTETPSRDGQGGQRRQFHQIGALTTRGHEVTVLVPASPQDDTSVQALATVIRPRLKLFGRVSRRRVRQLRALIRRPGWDAIIVSHHESAWLLGDEVAAPVLIDVHNLMSDWHRRTGRDAERDSAHALEARALHRADGVMTCSAVETRRLVEAHPDAAGKAFTAPLGVDPAEWPERPFARAEPLVVLFGSWAWQPNRLGLEWFLAEVWPRVTDRVPAATALVAGTGVESTAGWPSGVRFVGRVPDLSELTAAATVVAVPVRDGVGASVKFAEALASGAAVIATGDGANAFDDPPAAVSDDAGFWAVWIAERLELRLKEPAPTPARALALESMSWDAAAAPIDAWIRARGHSTAGVG